MAVKIDLTSRFAETRSSHSNVEKNAQRSKSGSSHPDKYPTFPSRTTASSGIVGSKPSSKVGSVYKKGNDSAIESCALGGMSEEDDSLEKDLAMSSLVKGSEFRTTMKVVHFYCITNY
jgi:hypothetical protein